jgi:hypothetical protein
MDCRPLDQELEALKKDVLRKEDSLVHLKKKY